MFIIWITWNTQTHCVNKMEDFLVLIQ